MGNPTVCPDSFTYETTGAPTTEQLLGVTLVKVSGMIQFSLEPWTKPTWTLKSPGAHAMTFANAPAVVVVVPALMGVEDELHAPRTEADIRLTAANTNPRLMAKA